MLGRKTRLRPHIGKMPMKFIFRAQDITVSLPGLDVAGKLVLVWKRGARRTPTQPFEVKETLSSIDGSLTRSAATPQDLALICTMFKNTRAGTFESKSAAFTLREETEDGEANKLGTAYIDLACYATPEPSTDRVELSMLDGKVVVSFSLSSHWLKQMGAADDDELSVSSCGSLRSGASGFTGASSDAGDGDIANLASLGTLASHAQPRSRARPFGVLGTQEEGGTSTYTPMDPAERRAADEAAERQIEAMWTAEEAKERNVDEAELLRAEARAASEKYTAALKEGKRAKEEVKRLTHENRVLRREQRKGARDEVILQLETELSAKEAERAEMEEQLSAAFGGLLNDAQARIAAITAERDRLLVSIESGAARKGAFR